MSHNSFLKVWRAKERRAKVRKSEFPILHSGHTRQFVLSWVSFKRVFGIAQFSIHWNLGNSGVYVCKCAPQSGKIAEFLRENLFECWQHGRAGPAADIPLDYPTSSHTVSYSFSSDTDSVIGLFFKQFKDFKKVIKGQPHEGGGGRTETNTADRTDVSMQ